VHAILSVSSEQRLILPQTDCAHGSFIAICCEDLLVLSDVCPNQYSADLIFSGGISGAGSKDFKIVRKSTKRELPATAQLATIHNPSEDAGIVEDQASDNTVLQKRVDLNYDAHNPCDASFEYSFPTPAAALGYIAVYADNIVYGSKGDQKTWGIARSKVTITSSILPDLQTRFNHINRKTCPGDRYPQLCAESSPAQSIWFSLTLPERLCLNGTPTTIRRGRNGFKSGWRPRILVASSVIRIAK
jgi:hypothetical protein